MNALAEFKDYYKRLDEMIAESTKENLAALNCALYIRYVFWAMGRLSGRGVPPKKPQNMPVPDSPYAFFPRDQPAIEAPFPVLGCCPL